MGKGKIYYVNPHEVMVTSNYVKRDVLYQKQLLQRQGQIVPLLCKKNASDDWVVSNKDYPYSGAQVRAARELGWETIIITDSLEED